MKPKLRSMTADDKPPLMQILRVIPEFTPSEVIVAEEVIDSYLDDPVSSGYYIIIADVNSIVTGYICYGPTPLTEGTWDLYWMAVAPDQQGLGIGKALISYVEEKIKRARGRLAFIETSSKPEYEKTRRFHYARGYDPVCLIPDFYAPGDDKLILQKRLT